MAEFRKWFPVLAVASLMFGAATTANAQTAFTCNTNAGVPPLIRAEGLTELVGDLILNCTGGVPTALGAQVPRVNFQIFLNTNVTSRLLSDPWSEALLMIDEPSGTNSNLRYCTTNGGCAMTGVGTAGGVNYLSGDAQNLSPANVFQGQQVGANAIAWNGVPVDPPGSVGTRIIRMTNVRANANQLGVSSTLIPTQIFMYVSATSTTSLPINNPQQVVAYVQPGMSFSTRTSNSAGYLQCTSVNRSAATDSSASITDSRHVLRFTEGFASSFKRRSQAYTNADESPVWQAQNVPNNNYFTETGFYNPTPVSGANNTAGLTTNISQAGRASQGTRLMAKFSNVPAGVVLYATIYELGGTSANSRLRLISTDTNGGGAFSAVSATSGGTYAPISLSNGAGMVVYEVMTSNPTIVEYVEVGLAVSYVANTSSNLPGLGTASVAGSFAPLSTVTTASAIDNQPRFADTSAARTLFTINACSTNILFPFLSNQLGFDSGIAIANTSTDPFGTSPQTGACKLNYYGETTGGGAAPAAQTSQSIPSGKTLTATLSSGGTYGIAATPGFQGYVIAQCAFQYAHGFAFISDVGANRVSEAYLALILDSALSSRTPFYSETLGH